MMAGQTGPCDVTTTLHYYHPDSGNEHRPGTVGEKRRKHTPVEVTIKDMRGREQDFNLDKQGFQVVNYPSVEKLFNDEAKIKEVYYRECADLVKSITGATRAVPFSHVVRKQSFHAEKEAEKDLPDDARSSGPTSAGFVHIDQSYQGAYDRAIALFPDEPEILSRVRWGIINVWRAIKPVSRNPLAMADARSVADSELKEVLVVFPKTDYAGEEDKENQAPKVDYYKRNQDIGLWQVHAPKSPDQHKWFYASNMQPDEALLLKIFDSKRAGVARRSPHTSFSSALDHGSVRESLEVRIVVIWNDQTSG